MNKHNQQTILVLIIHWEFPQAKQPFGERRTCYQWPNPALKQLFCWNTEQNVRKFRNGLKHIISVSHLCLQQSLLLSGKILTTCSNRTLYFPFTALLTLLLHVICCLFLPLKTEWGQEWSLSRSWLYPWILAHRRRCAVTFRSRNE